MVWSMRYVLIFLCTTACGTAGSDFIDPDQDDDGEVHWSDLPNWPGFADSEAQPEGLPWVLPPGVELVQPSASWWVFEPEKCRNDDDDPPFIPYGFVMICLEFRNTTNAPIDVTLPPGLILVSESTDTQNGLVTQSMEIEVPAKPQYFHPVHASCVNGSRSPTATGDTFRKGPIIQYNTYKELFSMLENKFFDDPTLSAQVDLVVSELSWRKPFDEDLKAKIRALPDK